MFGWGKKDKPATAEKPKAQKAAAPAALKPASTATKDNKSDLKVDIKERKGCSAVLAIQVSAKKVEEATEDSFRRIQ
ncbi:MAG TPA: hypothetical protein P5079_10655, partial [Elusimicrobiota bacterium]|nr:hypothetical protein [Elusimicrobiota bacterium]